MNGNLQQSGPGVADLQRVIRSLEVDASAEAAAHQATHQPERRRDPRIPMRVECDVYFLPRPVTEAVSLPGKTRNISRGGIAVLVRRAFQLFEPVEVVISGPRLPQPLHLAGEVVFCRFVGGQWHEIGVRLHETRHEPIIIREPRRAAVTRPWLLAWIDKRR